MQEILNNQPIEKTYTLETLQAEMTNDFFAEIYRLHEIDLTQSTKNLSPEQIEKILSSTREFILKIFSVQYIQVEHKKLLFNILMSIIFNMWLNSADTENFFRQIQKFFTPAQIVSALTNSLINPAQAQIILNFFQAHKNFLAAKNKKIKTVALFYPRVYSGGTERYIAAIIPHYIEAGYKVVLFTTTFEPEIEYPLPTNSANFVRVVLKSQMQDFFEFFQELEIYLRDYEVDCFISQLYWAIPPMSQILLCKLSGVRFLMHFHTELYVYLMHPLLWTPAFKLADGVINLSKMRREFWKNLGVRSYYIPNPVSVDGEKNFPEYTAKKSAHNLLWVGRISDANGKNTFAALLILREVVKKFPDAKLKIVGEVSQEDIFDAMKKFIAENNLEKNVEFCGFQTEVKKFYLESDVMLHTSPREGWSLVIAESKIFSLPLVAYDLADNELLSRGGGVVSAWSKEILWRRRNLL